MKNLSHLNRFMVVLFTMLTMSLTQVWGAEAAAYTLTPIAGTNSGYASNCDVTIDGIKWNVTGNSTLTPWRLGGKATSKDDTLTVDRTIFSKDPIADSITSVVVTNGTAGITVNSFTLTVASDADFNEVISSVEGTFEASATTKFSCPSTDSWKGRYYKFTYNVSVKGTSNKYLQFSGAVFNKQKNAGDPSLEVSPASISFDDVLVGTTSVEGKEVTVTIENIEEVLVGLSTESPFQVDKESLTESGTVTITPTAATLAAAGEYKDTLLITDAEELTKKVPVAINVVAPATVNSIAFNQDSVSVKVGKTLKLKYTIAPDNATDQRVSFQSLNEDALTVTEDGTITGVAENASVAVVITAEDSLNTGEKLTDTCYVEVKTIPVPTTQQYLKLTSAPADWSGEYILVYEATNDSACVFSGVDAASNFVPAEINKKSITGAFITLTLAKMEGGYSVMVNGGENDGKYLAGNTSSNKLNFNQTATLNTIEMGEDGVVITSGRVLQYNSSKSDNRFRYYSAGGQNAVQLYKLKKQTSQPVPVTEIVADNATDTVMVNETLELKYTIAPDSATDQRVEFVITEGAEFATIEDEQLKGVAEGDVVVTATALDSLNTGDKLTATYTIHVKAEVLNTCAEANAAAKGDKLKLNTVTTVYVNGSNIYVKDASGSTLVYLSDSGVKAGDVISGIKGVASPYSGLPELKPSNAVSDWTIVAGEAPAIPEATAAPTAAEVNQVLEWKGVTGMDGEFTSASATNITGKFGTEDINFRNNFKLAYTFDADKTYDITGAVAIYVKDATTTIQIYFISAKEHEGSGIKVISENAKAVKKMMLDGQMVIVRDGKMFNALGAEL